MAEDFIQFAFSAGELSPALAGRSDIESFDLGLNEASNWFIDYRGGASTRPGFEFCDYIQDDSSAVRGWKFHLNNNIADSYYILFSLGKIRFLQNGAYVLEATKAITGATVANPAVITATAHCYTTGDWVKISSVGGMPSLTSWTFQVGTTTSNTFQLLKPDGSNFSSIGIGPYTSGGTAQRIYTVTHSYAVADLRQLHFEQNLDVLKITHTSYAPATLTYTSSISWALAIVPFDLGIGAVTSITLTKSSSGSAGLTFQVTAVNALGEEGRHRSPVLLTACVDYSSVAGSVLVSWLAVTDASYYKVYRTLIFPTQGLVTYGEVAGLIGISNGLNLIDNNITPDFTQTPPIFNPVYTPGAILSVTVTAIGSGYVRNTVTVSFGGGGTGASGYAIVGPGATIDAVIITDPGKNYVNPTVTISVTGTGATATATAAPLVNVYPGCSAAYQQRQLYAGALSEPLTVRGSVPGGLDNFSSSFFINASDAYAYSLGAEEIDPINYISPTDIGLFCFTASSVWFMRGADDAIITALSVKADLFSTNGSAYVKPLRIGKDIIYLQWGSFACNIISGTGEFSQTELSTRSTHLFDFENQITSWAFHRIPHSYLWATREDGSAVSMTFVKSENVRAWSRHSTQGQFMDFVNVYEEPRDVIYAIVKRLIGGVWRQFVERSYTRQTVNEDFVFAVDSGLTTALTYPAATVNMSGLTGSITVTASAGVFVGGDVGKHFRVGDGRGTVTGYTSATVITVLMELPIIKIIPQSDIYAAAGTALPAISGEWSLTAKVSSVSGLDHLEGRLVEVLADGVIVANQTVTNGAISLGASYSHVVVGLGYFARLRTLPLSSQSILIDGKRKRVTGLALRTNQSRKLWLGTTIGKLFEQKEQTNIVSGAPTLMQTEIKFNNISSRWTRNDSIVVEKRGPIHATILGLVPQAEIGDDKD